MSVFTHGRDRLLLYLAVFGATKAHRQRLSCFLFPWQADSSARRCAIAASINAAPPRRAPSHAMSQPMEGAAGAGAGGDDDAAAAARRVLSLSTGYIVSAALHAVATLDVASQLAAGPRDAASLACSLGGGVDCDALCRVMRALTAHGVFAEPAPRTFALNAPARALLPGSPARAQVLWLADPLHLRAHGRLLAALSTPRPPVVEALLEGAPLFEYMEQNAALGATFNDAMSAFSDAALPELLAAYDFSRIQVLADIGGGHGRLLAAVLAQHPSLRGVLFDLPHVVAGAGEALGAAGEGVAARCDVRAGDFFDASQLPRDADALLLKHIIHDWDDDEARAILANAAAALAEQSPESRDAERPVKRVLLLERVLPSDADIAAACAPPDAVTPLLDLEMLVLAGGRERSEDDFARLFARAGLLLHAVTRMPSGLCVIEARLAQ
jgi:hypothetical protein